MEFQKKKFLFFTPYSGVWVHSFPEALLASSLKESGHDVSYIHCGRLYKEDCIVKKIAGVKFDATPEAKEKICKTCEKTENILKHRFNWESSTIRERVTEEDISEANSLVEHGLNFTDLYKTMVDGIPVGVLTAFEFFTSKKLLDPEKVTGQDLEQYRNNLKDAILTLRGAEKILDEQQPDCVVVYNAEYSVNGIWGKLCEKKNTMFYSENSGVNFSNRLERFQVNIGSYFYGNQTLLRNWPVYKKFHVSKNEAEEITNHFLALFEGKSLYTYSTPKARAVFSPRAYFGLKPEQKLFVATLSSKDELFAAELIGQINPVDSEENPFFSQEHWTQALIEHFKSRPDYFLVIRIHPREYPNKRDKIKSQNYEKLQASLVNLPPNVKVNWPTDGLSIYDLMEETDVFLNGWSTAGKEMSFFGLPVVTYCGAIVAYPLDLVYSAKTRKEFFEMMDEALKTPFDPERIRLNFRWLAWEFIRSNFLIDDAFTFPEREKRSLPYRVANKLTGGQFRYVENWWRVRHFPNKLAATGDILKYFDKKVQTPAELWEPLPENLIEPEVEERIIKKEMKRIYGLLYKDQKLWQDAPSYTLRYKLGRWLS